MLADITDLLRCPACQSGPLTAEAFSRDDTGEIGDGVLVCAACRDWYPVEAGLLEFLPPALAYADDRRAFWGRHTDALTGLGLNPFGDGAADADAAEKKLQQSHFDWYANNETQTWDAYERLPFWQAVDAMTFEGWRPKVAPGSRFLEVGCAQGRSLFNFMDLPITAVGFDISKSMIRTALDRYKSGDYTARGTFFVGDAGAFPFRNETFESVMLHGVLHHLPDPAASCGEIARLLKPGGRYFGFENNTSALRALFDLLQRLNPLWYEEAGEHPLISGDDFRTWLAPAGLVIEEMRTSVYLPPHLLNMFSATTARSFLTGTDRLMGALPFMKNNGGLIVVEAVKPSPSNA
ncbi:MAG: methyltransferase domain-containing protein [Nitrospinae bacterium]|nr:methyltransferase domain-containing protein [Nitrospinota bacterium]